MLHVKGLKFFSDVTLATPNFLTPHTGYTFFFWRRTYYSDITLVITFSGVVVILTLSDVTHWLRSLFLTLDLLFWRHTVFTLTLSDVTLQPLVALSTPTDGERSVLWVLDAELCSSSEAPVRIATIYSTAQIRYSLSCNEKLCMCAWRCNVNLRFIHTEWKQTRSRHRFEVGA